MNVLTKSDLQFSWGLSPHVVMQDRFNLERTLQDTIESREDGETSTVDLLLATI
jgi:hypothetical protein